MSALLPTTYSEFTPEYWANTEDFIALRRAYDNVLTPLMERVAATFKDSCNPTTYPRETLIELLTALGFGEFATDEYADEEMRELYIALAIRHTGMTEAEFVREVKFACPDANGDVSRSAESAIVADTYTKCDDDGCHHCQGNECTCRGVGGCSLVKVIADCVYLTYKRGDAFKFSYDVLMTRIKERFPTGVRLKLQALLSAFLRKYYYAMTMVLIDMYTDAGV